MHFALISSVLSLTLLTSSPVLAASAQDAKAAFAVRPEEHIVIAYPHKVLLNTPTRVSFSENKDPKLYPGLQYNVSLSVFSPDGEPLQTDLPAGAATIDAFSETACLTRPGNGTVSGLTFDTVGIYTLQWTFTYATPTDPSKESKTSCGTGPFSTEAMTLKFNFKVVDTLNPTDPAGFIASTLSNLAAQPTGLVEDVDTRSYVRASGTAGADSRPDSTGIPGGKGGSSSRNGAARVVSGGAAYLALVIAGFALF